MKNNKGFAATGILYTILVLFLVTMASMLALFYTRSSLLNKIKSEIKGEVSLSNYTCSPVKIQNAGMFTIGDEYRCNPGDGRSRTFYLLEESATQISLLMDRNIGGNVAYADTGSNVYGPITATAYLRGVTSAWKDVTVSMPSYNQIYNVDKTDTLKSAWLYKNSNCALNTTNCSEVVSNDTANQAQTIGYWTYDAYNSTSDEAWLVQGDGYLTRDYLVDDNTGYGVRPLITLDKSKLKTYTKYENGTAIYYNPETGEKCDAASAVSTTGTKTGCMKWYSFNDSEYSDSVNLLLDHNTTSLVVWNSAGNNKEMKEAATQLASDTTSWSPNIKSTARLISADEVAKITGSTFNSATANYDKWYYFDSLTQTKSTVCRPGNLTGCKFGWLYDRTYVTCQNFGCNNNAEGAPGIYWTSTRDPNNNISVWYIQGDGSIYDDDGDCDIDAAGIRPVITVKKINL